MLMLPRCILAGFFGFLVKHVTDLCQKEGSMVSLSALILFTYYFTFYPVNVFQFVSLLYNVHRPLYTVDS